MTGASVASGILGKKRVSITSLLLMKAISD